MYIGNAETGVIMNPTIFRFNSFWGGGFQNPQSDAPDT